LDQASSKLKPQYVSGAPRDNDLAGKVIIFRFPESNSDKMEKLSEIHGSQTGSYFGSSLCVADINGDGFDDLLVGAPRYSAEHKKAKAGLQVGNVKRGFDSLKDIGYGDEGAVFIFLSNNGVN
jgi:hypothetical protein